ncbi:MAG: hypothetical protein J7L96_06315 [Bacteroidales bacterium]|nr:hypothetical protein [Bacteroidales bacterium]
MAKPLRIQYGIRKVAKATDPADWAEYLYMGHTFAPLVDNRVGDVEIGGPSSPAIAYNAGVSAVGGFTIYPRIGEAFTYLLYSVLGANTVVADTDLDDNSATGVYQHTHKFASTNLGDVKYVDVHYEMEDDAGDKIYVGMEQGKPIQTTLGLPYDGALTVNQQYIFTDYVFSTTTNLSTADYKDVEEERTPYGVKTGGYIKIAGSEIPVLSAQIGVANGIGDPRQLRKIGSNKLVSIPIVARVVTFDLICMFDSFDLYRTVLTGSSSGTDSTSSTYKGAVSVRAFADEEIVSDYPFGIDVAAGSVALTPAGPPTAASQQNLLWRLTGTAIGSDEDYVVIKTVDGVATAIS